jgi:putative endonuclease
MKDQGYYIGCTSKEISERLKKHNSGHVRSTKYRRPWKLFYWEEYLDKSTAFKREYFLKHPEGYKSKLNIINRCVGVAQPQRGPF